MWFDFFDLSYFNQVVNMTWSVIFHSTHNCIIEGGTLNFNRSILMVGPTNGCEAIINCPRTTKIWFTNQTQSHQIPTAIQAQKLITTVSYFQNLSFSTAVICRAPMDRSINAASDIRVKYRWDVGPTSFKWPDLFVGYGWEMPAWRFPYKSTHLIHWVGPTLVQIPCNAWCGAHLRARFRMGGGGFKDLGGAPTFVCTKKKK